MMQRAQSIDTAKPRGSIQQDAGYATAPGFARCLSPEREHGDPQTANRVRQGAACAAPYILSTVSTRTQKTPRFASERLFQRGFAFGITRAEHLVGMHSESPGSNALPAGIRNRQSETPCRHAFACARAERHAGMHSHLPEPNGTPASQARPPSP